MSFLDAVFSVSLSFCLLFLPTSIVKPFDDINLSGGNQQKVIISRWLSANCDILIYDEPTRGIDIGAKDEIYKIMNELVEEGKSIIMISSELEEILGLSDRIIVIRQNEIQAELPGNANEKEVMTYAVGGNL